MVALDMIVDAMQNDFHSRNFAFCDQEALFSSFDSLFYFLVLLILTSISAPPQLHSIPPPNIFIFLGNRLLSLFFFFIFSLYQNKFHQNQLSLL
jgi:hypothetical protein